MARGKAGRKKIDNRGPLQRALDAERIDREQSELDVITPEQRAKGTYIGLRTIVNNHDPVERWKAAGKLDQRQIVIIEMMQRLWRLAGIAQRVTASYSERMPSSASYELRAITEIEAREDLHRIQGYFHQSWWNIFENVVRHGMAAGMAGGEADRNGAHKAYVTVCMIADHIAAREGYVDYGMMRERV